MSNKSFINSERFEDYLLNLSVEMNDNSILSSIHPYFLSGVWWIVEECVRLHIIYSSLIIEGEMYSFIIVRWKKQENER